MEQPIFDAMGIAVFPNPTTGITQILLPKNQCQVRVTDLDGKLIFEQTAAEKLEISTENWRNGLYFIQIEVEDGSQRAVRKKWLNTIDNSLSYSYSIGPEKTELI